MARFTRSLIGILLCLLAALGYFQTIGLQCKENQFACANVNCIPVNWRCDGDNDCDDHSDEKDCPERTCDPATKFKCKTVDRCIPKRWVCDYDDDCGDGSDEHADCAQRTCSTNEHACTNGQCIPNKWLCDRERDCHDGSDEKGCGNKTCRPNEFTCANSKCISQTWRCDHDDDCGDGSDEMNCPNKTCSPDEFTCKNGRCTRMNWKCDGDNDCGDNSDEIACPSKSPTCKSTQILCDDAHQCVHRSWRCDGEEDCDDGSDEKRCNITASCNARQFTCTNGRCIDEDKRCNGRDDCLDNSDEQKCDEPTTTPCKQGEFQCGDFDQCIPESKVCDGNPNDCPNNEDEPMSCDINECIDNNGHCQQFCNDTKTSYFCSCYQGYEVDKEDPRLCLDKNECDTPGTCSQVCYNYKGGYKCLCRDGYFMEPDRHGCKALGDEGFLIFANRHDIRNLTFDSSDYTELIPGQKGAIALDFDFSRGYIYWTDVIDENIKRAKIEYNPKVEVLVKINLDTPDGIAIDWINRKMYWTDTGNDMIEVADLEGTDRLELVKTGLEEPRAIVVHPFLGYMFWSDWGEKPKIEKCGMNGDENTRHVIISDNIMWPNALTIDYTIDRIWWADAKLRAIESADFDGRDRRIILSETIHHPFAMTIFEDYMYWTDWEHGHGSINKANKFTGEKRYTLKESLYNPMDLHVYHEQRQPRGVNPCRSAGEFGSCSHICLLAPRVLYPDGYSCHCPPGVMLLYDSKTCNTTGAFKCKKNTCLNGGTCHPGKNLELPTCICPLKFKGKHCEITPPQSKPTTTTTPTPATHKIPWVQARREEEDVGVTVGISIAVIVLLSAIGLLAGWLVYRRIQRNNRRSMNFDNPVYKKTTESNSSLDRISIHFGGHSNGKNHKQSLLGSFQNEVEVSSC